MIPAPLILYGTIAIDTLITPSGRADKVAGGSGIYAALAARLICPAHELIGVVGDDYPPDWQARLERCGVNFQHVIHAPGSTFAWTGQYEEDMNLRATLRTMEGVQAQWQPTLPDELRQSVGVVVAANVTPPLQVAFLRQCNPNALILADFMKSWIIREPNYTRQLLSMVDVALMNDEEAREFAQTEDLSAAGYALLQAGPHYAIVKHGSAGSTMYHRDDHHAVRCFHCPPMRLEHTADPTGAGDSYLGALSGYLNIVIRGKAVEWEDMCHAMVCGSAIAACTCEQFGAEGLIRLKRFELKKRLLLYAEENGLNPPPALG